jgi:hypothetical protein
VRDALGLVARARGMGGIAKKAGFEFDDFYGLRARNCKDAYALNDSPVALAMWMYEKFWEWTDNRGLPENALTRDQMLDDISLYRLTGAGTSSARLYWEDVGSTIRESSFFSSSCTSSDPIDLPMGATIFPGETFRDPGPKPHDPTCSTGTR